MSPHPFNDLAELKEKLGDERLMDCSSFPTWGKFHHPCDWKIRNAGY